MSPQKPTLLVLAAGMGSRYGGLKQIDPMGPNGETVLDYAVFDAIRAGFGRVVFIIRKDFADDFQKGIGSRFADKIQVDYAYQSLDDLPPGFSVPEGRTKPWGTAHAVHAARKIVNEPFAVINADDFYGRDAFERAATFLRDTGSADTVAHYGMIGYPLINTLSDHGEVNRGICTQNADSYLTDVEEYVNIKRDADGIVRGNALDGTRNPVDEDCPVSMNFWLFQSSFFEHMEAGFSNFLSEFGKLEKSEYYIPTVVDSLIRNQQADCKVLETTSSWFGVTYPQDKEYVVSSIAKLIEQGEYPQKLS